jgi:hypothetical protein
MKDGEDVFMKIILADELIVLTAFENVAGAQGTRPI